MQTCSYIYVYSIYYINTSKFYDGQFAASPYICWQNYWCPCWLSLHWTPIVMAPPSPSDLRSEDPVQRYPPEPMRPKARLRLRELSLESVVRGVHGRFHGYNTHIHTQYIYIYIYIERERETIIQCRVYAMTNHQLAIQPNKEQSFFWVTFQ